MAAKLLSLILTMIFTIAAGVIILLTMVVAMNGYSESDATWGFIVFIGLATAGIALISAAAYLLSRSLLRRNFKPLTSVVIAVPACTAAGMIFMAIASLAGVGAAEFVRVNY